MSVVATQVNSKIFSDLFDGIQKPNALHPLNSRESVTIARGKATVAEDRAGFPVNQSEPVGTSTPWAWMVVAVQNR